MVPAIDLELNWDFPSPHVGEAAQLVGVFHSCIGEPGTLKSNNRTGMAGHNSSLGGGTRDLEYFHFLV